VPPEIGAGFTNLGNCIPNKPMVGSNTAKVDEMDKFFAEAKELPERLEQTDFTALDSETLARNGVVSFAPAYPLYSDGAGKMRHIRVPRGKSVVFDKATQQFTIPDNTRFYKTFLKKVVDREGNESYRKIETRLIVSRRDGTGANGAAELQSLFGTYVWNDDETEALLLREPLRDGTPFTDLMLTYITDEPKAQRIRDGKPANLTYELEERNPGLLRRYAIPGSGRCRECHMGSSDASFSLGFTPLQIRRRPGGEGGTLEPFPIADELTQLDRLIEYGVITGLKSAAEVNLLEDSQGTRKPRNEQELTAQGYMLGNCAGCHNPRGFPTVKNAELRSVLNFLPSSDGGIFQFPLERTSPRIKRGKGLDDPIPYITPSLRDLPRDDGTTDPTVWKPKWFKCDPAQADCKLKGNIEFIEAPWRSLIYRNVDAPFSYSDDYAIFPHMPRNTPGYDCRAPRIMGSWMVSIPAKRKNTDLGEDSFPGAESPSTLPPDLTPQPYVEVAKDDPLYVVALADAKERLRKYQTGRRYAFCPDGTDILDARVRDSVIVPPDQAINKDGKATQYADNVPDRAHWIPTDLTEAPVAWLPRRFDWDKVLVPEKLTDKSLSVDERANKDDLFASYQSVLESLNHVRISKELRDLSLTEFPYGLWKVKPECADKLKAVRTGGQYAGGERPAWMDKGVNKVPADAPVYRSSVGAAVFNLICVNCHGPKADSRGIQAETLADLTGGATRVANLRDGLLGHGSDGAANIDRVFGAFAGLYPKNAPDATLVTAEDWAARYVAWMGLGGTAKKIPQAILNNVGVSSVLGAVRRPFTAPVSANMLQAAQLLCRGSIPHSGLTGDLVDLKTYFAGDFLWETETPLVDSNGDAEMWQRLCSIGNRQIVRVARRSGEWTPGVLKIVGLKTVESYYWADGYPANAPVMDQHGKIQMGVHADNSFAVCAEAPDDPAQKQLFNQWLTEHPVGGAAGKVMPTCPPELFELDATTGFEKWRMKISESETPKFLDVDAWAARGAINAGVAVMLYLQQVQKGAVQPTPRFDQCQEL
jgi:mono/diheme cytochrome c family protein